LTLRTQVFAAAALLLAGCLPSSRRGTTETLLPADSLSREIAAGVGVDTLAEVWRGGGEPMQLPTSVAWLASGTVIVADTRGGSLRFFDGASGAPLAGSEQLEPFAYPYLAGSTGDSVAVLVRGDNRLQWVAVEAGRPRALGGMPVPEGATAALAAPPGAWVKRADENEAWLARLDSTGREVARHPLPGPSWRRIGFLRRWGDALVSLSGYRPVVDTLALDAPAGATPDTLLLAGFDSPQLLRSHRFILGEVDQPPLLTSSAVPLGDSLLVVNLRSDHVRIDVYDRAGRLQRALVHHGAGAGDHFPVDLAARRDPSGVLLALVMQRPGGLLSQPGGYVLVVRWGERGER
jgi:hypothetical protein